MSDTFYSVPPGEVYVRQPSDVTVGASTAGGSSLELRVTNGAVTAEQVYFFLEQMADYFAVRNAQVIPPGTLTG